MEYVRGRWDGDRQDLHQRNAVSGAVMDHAEMERMWARHLDGEFASKDVEVTLETMTDDAMVNHVPVGTGGKGKTELRSFYRDVFIPGWPAEQEMKLTNRVLGDDQLVDELHASFRHDVPMEWFLPGVPPTARQIEVVFVVIVGFRSGLIASERIYWDHANVLRQIGMLP
jgi:carboxymethylenebutenolidase